MDTEFLWQYVHQRVLSACCGTLFILIASKFMIFIFNLMLVLMGGNDDYSVPFQGLIRSLLPHHQLLFSPIHLQVILAFPGSTVFAACLAILQACYNSYN